MAKKAEMTAATYFSIVVTEKQKPYFGIYSENAKEGTTQIETFDGEGKSKGVKNYELYEEIEGKIKSVKVYDKELNGGKKFEVLSVTVVTESGALEIVSVAFSNQFAHSFIKVLENVKQDEAVKLKVFRIEDKEKSEELKKKVYNDYFCVYQKNENGIFETVKSPYKFIASEEDPKVNANPKQLPKFVEKTIKKNGKNFKEWDLSEYNEALRMIVANVNPTFKTAYENSVKIPDAPTTQDPEINTGEMANDDLPF